LIYVFLFFNRKYDNVKIKNMKMKENKK